MLYTYELPGRTESESRMGTVGWRTLLSAVGTGCGMMVAGVVVCVGIIRWKKITIATGAKRWAILNFQIGCLALAICARVRGEFMRAYIFSKCLSGCATCQHSAKGQRSERVRERERKARAVCAVCVCIHRDNVVHGNKVGGFWGARAMEYSTPGLSIHYLYIFV